MDRAVFCASKTVDEQMHASVILSQDSLEYAPLFAEIADAYFDREMYAEAGHIYEMLGADASVSDNILSSADYVD